MPSITVDSNTIVLEVLDQHNYEDWSSRVETYLLAEDLWDVVNIKPPEPEEGEAEYNAWMTKNAKALHAIKVSCGNQLFYLIRKTRTAKTAWKVLERQFKSSYILSSEKKEREERDRSLHPEIDDAREALTPADEDMEIKSGEGGNQNSSNCDFDSSYQPFFDSVVNGDWDNAEESLATLLLPNALRARNPADGGCTALHVAARKGHVHTVKELVLLMTREDLEIRDANGCTALHIAVVEENVDVVKELVPLMRQQGLGIKDNISGCTALHIAAEKGCANIVKELVELMREEDLEIGDSCGCHALHVAVMNGHGHIVKELVPSMRKEALEIKDGQGCTALGCALRLCIESGVYSETDVIEMIKPMVAKNQEILGIVGPPYNKVPIIEAYRWLKFQVGRYLYSFTPREALMPPENGSQGASLIVTCLGVNEFDIPWDLLSKCPMLATVETDYGCSSPILVLSRLHSAFLSRMRPLKIWQKWIYNSISIQAPAISDIHNLSLAVSNLDDDGGTQRDPSISSMTLRKRLVKGLLEVLGVNRIYEMKLIHVRILEIIRWMGEATRNDDDLLQLMKKSIFEAIEQGDLEFVTHVCKANPKLVQIFDDKGRSIFHFAVECRQEEIYCLIYGLVKKKRNAFASYVAEFNTTMLHAAGNLSPFSQSNHIQGSSLQMQRELQWFKEVESIIPMQYHEIRTHSDDSTARELFHKKHEELMEAAEISMKGTATSCTTVGALIITIMFAAAFTIPGGNNGTTGLPMFINENLFLVFVASDTISLVCSTTAVIIFLGILASRYSEEDFFRNLPTKMMIGLCTLFIAIATMMITFTCGVIIMLHGKYSWVAIPAIFVASIPVATFVWMLFPLLVQTFISTYGPGIFNKKVKQWCEF